MEYLSNSVSGNMPEWITACEAASLDDEYFKIFRSKAGFMYVVEGTPRLGGQMLLDRLSRNRNFCLAFNKVRESDLYGAPQNLVTVNHEGNYVEISPTTLRYANNACNIVDFFGNLIFDIPIVEIGGGYGGECKIFNDLHQQAHPNCGELDWTFYDLPSSESLIKKWLSIFRYSAKFARLSGSIPRIASDSLVISNGAISEMHGALLDDYFNKVVLPSKYGYFIVNFDEHSLPYGGWSNELFIKKLIEGGKQDAAIFPAEEYLCATDSGHSALVVFGMGKKRPPKNLPIKSFYIRIKSKILHLFVPRLSSTNH